MRGSFAVEPLTASDIVLPLPEFPSEQKDVELLLEVSLRLKKAELWAEAGHEVAWAQLPVRLLSAGRKPAHTLEAGMPELTETSGQWRVRGSAFEAAFDTATGTLVSYRFEGAELLRQGPEPTFWRAMTDNDQGSKLPERAATWRQAGQKRTLRRLTKRPSADAWEIIAELTLDTTAVSFCTVRYTVFEDGTVAVEETLIPGEGLPELPAMGMMLMMDAEYDRIEWYGRGPHENHWDRAYGAKLGVYASRAEEEFMPYLKPQECGNKTGVRWIKVHNEAGRGLLFTAENEVEASVLPYSPAELEESDHVYKLPPADKTVVRILHKQMGVGGNESWSAKTHPEFTLYANRIFTYRYMMSGVR
jgi:beta-galactosidase